MVPPKKLPGTVAPPTMPMPRNPTQTIPSFRELEASVEASIQEDKEERLRRREELASDGFFAENQFPPYPLQGFRIPPDPSHNAFGEAGFRSNRTLDAWCHDYRDTALWKGSGIPPSEDKTYKPEENPARLPLRVKGSGNLPIRRQQPLSPVKRTLSPLPPLQGYSPRINEKISISPSSSATERVPIPTRRQEQRLAPIRKHRAEPSQTRDQAHRQRLRKIGVVFLEVAAHTAKCDECNKRNQSGMSRCQNCGWQICNQCKNDRGGDQSHASFGAIHVPELGGDIPRDTGLDRAFDGGLDGAADEQPSYVTADVQAAQALVELAAEARRYQDAELRSGRFRGLALRPREGERSADQMSTDSEMTVSVGGDGDWPDDDPEVAVDDHGLLLGYFIARRNPNRAARPSSKLTE